LSSGVDLATTSGLLSIDDNGNIFSMGFPKGMIIMWKPQSSNLTPPEGWAVCDGNTPGVPNLTNKFIRGGTATDATASVITGGADTVKLDPKHLPNHTHSLVDGDKSIYRMAIHNGRNGVNLQANFLLRTGDYQVKQLHLDTDGQSGTVVDHAAIMANSYSAVNSTKNMDSVVNESLSILPSYYTLVYLMKL
jgi:microcystin-dependent protein